jgi:hypothetical protein
MICAQAPSQVLIILRICMHHSIYRLIRLCQHRRHSGTESRTFKHFLLQEKLETHAAGGEAGGDDLDDDFAAGSSENGESGDEGSSGSGDESDGEGAGPLQRRQRERAAGDHELQARLRWGR